MSVPGLLLLAQLAAPPTAPPLVTLVTPPWSDTTTLQHAERPVARFTHRPGAAVRGAVIPGTTTAVAIADTSPRRDPSFAASLFLLAPDAPARRLCDDVVHASRPLVAPDGRIFVARGVAGPDNFPDFRLDFLRIDEIDPATGVARTVHDFTGQFLHLAGWHEGTLLVYRVHADGADIVAVSPTTRAVHPLADVPPFARDFSVDGDNLVFHDRDESDPRTWHVEQLDLRTAALTTRAAAVDPRAQPFAALGTVFAATTGGPLHALDGRPLATPCAAIDCVDSLRVASPDARWLAGLHVPRGALPRPFILDAATGDAALQPAASAWVDLLGFLPGGAP